MSWLRFLDPTYAWRLERQYRQLVRLTHELAESSKTLANDATSMADGNIKAMQAGTRALHDIRAQHRTMHKTLKMIRDSMAIGKIGRARELVEGLLFLFDRGHL